MQHSSGITVLGYGHLGDGNIHVNIELNHPTILSILEEVITAAINEPILQKIKSYLEQSGYNYILFQGLRENNIEIKKITYISSLLIRKNIHLEHYLGCLSSIFNVLEGELTANKNAIIMKYKRVSNYNDMDGAETLINNMQQLGHTPTEIMKQLIKSMFIMSLVVGLVFAVNRQIPKSQMKRG